MTSPDQEKSLFQPDTKLIEWMEDIRRTIHQYPELANEEHRTQRYIGEKLHELGIPFRTEGLHTGVVATIGPSTPEDSDTHCVALRADLDALPVDEKTGLSFASKLPGLMHACGHDGHIAMLLGAAAMLRQVELPGKVVLLFQPAEESGDGALSMIDDGAFAGVQAIFAGHIDRHFNVGQIAAEPGLICAYTDKFVIKVCGRGGHAARPHETIDAIVVASLLVMSIQTLVSREINPSYPTVVSVGRFSGGSAYNVIAEEAVLEGTIRATHPEIRSQIIDGLERMVRAMDGLYNAKTTIHFREGLPPVINHPLAASLARIAAKKVVGHEGVVKQRHPSLGGEDFAYFLQKVPGCLVRFGAGYPNLPNTPAHSPYFDFDEGVLPIGAAFLAQVAWQTLQQKEIFMLNPSSVISSDIHSKREEK
ncbi:MAG: amidohydrolase [Deltaproteobacteria bacterium]|jgi:hippurate hydrolase|nr:MAG: amidohydrolase [Deltaproteobacteria bacterium]